jgi:hypothetical protein
MDQTYNDNKRTLKASIDQIYTSIENRQQTTPYDAIEEETKKVADRQEFIYTMLSTVAVFSVLFTMYRVRS